MAFEKSEEYKKALKEYQDNTYKLVLNPINVIVEDQDEVYLFYPQDKVNECLDILKKEYESDWDSCFPYSLWFSEPRILEYSFMWYKYKCVALRYDNEDIPEELLKTTKW